MGRLRSVAGIPDTLGGISGSSAVPRLTARQGKPNNAKFRELLLYVAKRSESDPDFGDTKLHKILFFAEFLAYGRTGKAITWQPFQKLEWGPAAKRLLPVRRKMEAAKEAATAERDHYGYVQRRMVALREPDLTEFSGPEIAIVDEVIEDLRGKNARDVSDLSHLFPGWQVARVGVEIPYEAVFLSSRPLTEEEKKYATELTPARAAAAPKRHL
jgi:hypothetical protein